MKRTAICVVVILSVLGAALIGMQRQPRIVYEKWPDPLSVGYQMPNADALRSLTGVRLMAHAGGSEEPATSFARTARIDTATLQASIERRFQAAAVPVQSNSTSILLVNAAVACAPIEPSV